jgi:uridine kinase
VETQKPMEAQSRLKNIWILRLFNIIRAVEMLRDKFPDKVICVGIAGPPGAGKTTLANKVKDILGEAVVIPLECFLQVDKVIDGNFDDISLVEFPLVKEALNKLKEGKTAQIPQVTIISSESRKRTGFSLVSVPQSRIILLEGSYVLHPTIRGLLDVTVAITGGVHLDLIKRILRDTLSANKAQKDVLLSVTNVMFPMYKAFIEPDIQTAKIRIHSTYNPMSSMVDPIYSCKANIEEVTPGAGTKWDYNTFVKWLPPSLRQQLPGDPLPPHPPSKAVSDMYLYPPKYNRYSEYQVVFHVPFLPSLPRLSLVAFLACLPPSLACLPCALLI